MTLGSPFISELSYEEKTIKGEGTILASIFLSLGVMVLMYFGSLTKTNKNERLYIMSPYIL